MKVLFVCLGNICRSPTAEAVFREKLKILPGKWIFDSAGTSANHIGETSDPRSIRHAQRRGYQMTHLARQFRKQDFQAFDLILVMDSMNLKNVLALATSPEESQKIQMITDFCLKDHPGKVPDPYYEGPEAFEEVLDLLEDAAEGFLQRFKKE